MNSTSHPDAFVQHVVDSQMRIYAYILTLLPDANEASDVLQQTNLALWRDVQRFTEGTSFAAWSLRVAYFKVLEHREKQNRERRRFKDSLLETLAEEAQALDGDHQERLEAMRQCLEKLPPEHSDLVRKRYYENQEVRAIAASNGHTANAVANSLYRIRRSLWTCIQSRLGLKGDV